MIIFSRRARLRRSAAHWHRAIQAAARDPEPYQQGLAADTLAGRFQMVSLVTVLVLRRVREEGKPGRALADRIYRQVFSRFDHALREDGVGDSSIARKMRKLGEEFFGLARAVDAALSGERSEQELAQVLVRNGVTSPQNGPALAAWLLPRCVILDALGSQQALSGAPDAW